MPEQGESYSGLGQIKPGWSFQIQCLVKTHDIKVTGQSKVFVSAVVADITGQVEMVHWDPTDSDVAAYDHDVVEIHGKAGTYKNKTQLTVEGVRVVPDGEIAWANVLPCSKRPEQELLQWLDQALKMLEGPVLSMVQQATANEYFRYCPAASTMHHAYVHGLLEHTVDVARIVINTASRGGFSLQIAVAGALLHDIGKMYEYSMTGRRLPLQKTLGHSLMGCQIVSGLASLHSVPQEDVNRICHVIASHHGRVEWGAIVEPNSSEAWVVHAADLIDAKLACAVPTDKE